jgi:hypothetical protein
VFGIVGGLKRLSELLKIRLSLCKNHGFPKRYARPTRSCIVTRMVEEFLRWFQGVERV